MNRAFLYRRVQWVVVHTLNRFFAMLTTTWPPVLYLAVWA
jgi:hypothetical protein